MINYSRQWIVRCQEMQKNSRDPDYRLRVRRLQGSLRRVQEDGGRRGPGRAQMLRRHGHWINQIRQVQTKGDLQQVQAVDDKIVLK